MKPSSSESNSNQERVLWVGHEGQESKENVVECAAAALGGVIGNVKVKPPSQGVE